MCNINIIIRKDGKKDPEVVNCMNVVSAISFQSNKDGDGFFGDDYRIHKHTNKMIYRGNYSFIVSHQRLSTSGRVPSMTQPIETQNFILVHNGIFRNVDEESDKHSDSYAYLKKLEKEYSLVGDTKKAIKNLNEKTTGYYSCILYNKITEELYYYKENISSMYIIENKNYRLMSTKEDNVDYMRVYFGLKGKISKVDDGLIYKLRQKTWSSPHTFNKYTYVPSKTYTSTNKNYTWNQSNWTDARKRHGLPSHTSTNKTYNPIRENPQDLAYEFKESLLHNYNIPCLTSVCIKKDEIIGDIYALKISVLPENTERFEDLLFNQAEVERTSARKTLYTLSLKRAKEHLEVWEGVKDFMEMEKMDLSTNEIKRLESDRHSETRYDSDTKYKDWDKAWWEYT